MHFADDASEEEVRAAEELATAAGDKARPGILEKYNIPVGVSFEVASFQEGIFPLTYYVGQFKKFILPFVSGTITEIELTDLVFRGGDDVECDYFWIFLDRPMFYYMDCPPGFVKPDVEDLRMIGWRKMKVQPKRWVASEAIKKYDKIRLSNGPSDELYAAHLIMKQEIKKQGYGRYVKYNPRVDYRKKAMLWMKQNK